MLTETRAGHPEIADALVSEVYMVRPGRPEEVAKTVTFLASDDAS